MGVYSGPAGFFSPRSKELGIGFAMSGHTILIPHWPVGHQCYGSLAAAIGCTWAGSQRIELS